MISHSPIADVHPDHLAKYALEQVDRAHGAVRHCILRVAQGCALNITALLSRTHGPLSADDIRSCIDAEHARIALDAAQFPTCNNDIASVLAQAGVADVLLPPFIDDYRATYETRLIEMIRRILPVYRPLPDRPHDMAAADTTLSTLLSEQEDPEGWQEPALVA